MRVLAPLDGGGSAQPRRSLETLRVLLAEGWLK